MSQKIHPVILCILDGWGYNPSKDNNAIKLANTPTWDSLVKDSLHSFLRTDGEYVGLPKGQMGNSEVGHLNIGAGRIIYQDLPKISKAFAEHEVESNNIIKQAINIAKEKKSVMHIMGLCSPGGIHSHIDHMVLSAEIFAKAGIEVKLHLFTDGRDTPPQSFETFLPKINKLINNYPNINIATIGGRYYGMDRDKRWDRIEFAYNAMVLAEGPKFKDAKSCIENGYNELKKENRIPSDEFIKPAIIGNYDGMHDNDMLFMINFRTDRARQILTALLDPQFNGFTRAKVVKFSDALGMVSYSKELDKLLKTIFPTCDLKNTLGEVIASNNLKQLRAAETEKYPHVTFFFNGGKETPFNGEDRILVPSPKVATYDLQPKMSACELTSQLVEAINSKKYSLIIVNFANGDMVGHTGVLDSAIKAVETIDSCLQELKEAAYKNDYTLFITADHGNSEVMWDSINNAPHTQHTVNPVRLIVFNPPQNIVNEKLNDGKLADVAPTILEVMGIKKPQEMTGHSLLKNK